MVTSKRKIETEQDRFGGYEERVSTEKGVFRNSQPLQISENENRMYSRTATHERDSLYSGRTTEKPNTFYEPVTTKRKVSLSEEDLMPSIKTMDYAEHKKKADSREALEGKTKLMLTIYMVIVVLLAAIVIGTGIVINSVSANIVSLSNQIQSGNEIITENSQSLDRLEDHYTIAGIAKDPNGLNMQDIEAGSEIEVEKIPFVEKTSNDTATNAFDSFCEWVKNLLG